MAVHLLREIERLKKQIILLSGSVEKNVENAVRSLEQNDIPIAQQVIDSDYQIDQQEIDVEEECLKILALHQPVAIDLRFIVAVLKINGDLERIGDEAVNICERSIRINSLPRPDDIFDFRAIFDKVQRMLNKSLDALVNMDARTARDVMTADDEIDEMVHGTFEQVKNAIRRHPEQVDALIEYLRICRHLERIADHATNIAEDIIYMIEGKIVRHGYEK
jgi:phosphate transport system protein